MISDQPEDSTGVAKLWASKVDSMKSALDFLCTDSGVVVTATNDLTLKDYLSIEIASAADTKSPRPLIPFRSICKDMEGTHGPEGTVKPIDETCADSNSRLFLDSHSAPPGLTSPHRGSDPRYAPQGIPLGFRTRHEDSGSMNEFSQLDSEAPQRFETLNQQMQFHESSSFLSKLFTDPAPSLASEWEKALQGKSRSGPPS